MLASLLETHNEFAPHLAGRTAIGLADVHFDAAVALTLQAVHNAQDACAPLHQMVSIPAARRGDVDEQAMSGGLAAQQGIGVPHAAGIASDGQGHLWAGSSNVVDEAGGCDHLLLQGNGLDIAHQFLAALLPAFHDQLHCGLVALGACELCAF